MTLSSIFGSLACSGTIFGAGSPGFAVGDAIPSRVTKIQPFVPYHLMPFGRSPEIVISTPFA